MAISAIRKLLNAALLKARVERNERDRRSRFEDEILECAQSEHRIRAEDERRIHEEQREADERIRREVEDRQRRNEEERRRREHHSREYGA